MLNLSRCIIFDQELILQWFATEPFLFLVVVLVVGATILKAQVFINPIEVKFGANVLQVNKYSSIDGSDFWHDVILSRYAYAYIARIERRAVNVNCERAGAGRPRVESWRLRPTGTVDADQPSLGADPLVHSYLLSLRDSNSGIPNPGIPDHFLNPESLDWRCFNPGISGLWKTNKMPEFYMIFARKKYLFFPEFWGQFPALKLRVSGLDPNTKYVIIRD